MPLTPNDRKAELVRRGRRMSTIARALHVSRSHIAQVIAGKRRSARVEQAIAEAIGLPVDAVFERRGADRTDPPTPTALVVSEHS